ncbi:papain fold toxin domain-containing protein [Methanobrevibacter sp.]
MPMLVASATGMAAFLSNSPVFMDICARFASGDLTVPELCNQIIETFNIIDQSIWDHIYEATNRGHSSSSSGSSSGGNSASGNIPPNDPNFWEKVNEAISKVSDRYKGLFKCDQFKDAFTRELDKRWINYEVIKVEPNSPGTDFIYSDKLGSFVTNNGYHYGVKIGDMVYDNLTTQGMNFVDWINDLGGRQYIHW